MVGSPSGAVYLQMLRTADAPKPHDLAVVEAAWNPYRSDGAVGRTVEACKSLRAAGLSLADAYAWVIEHRADLGIQPPRLPWWWRWLRV